MQGVRRLSTARLSRRPPCLGVIISTLPMVRTHFAAVGDPGTVAWDARWTVTPWPPCPRPDRCRGRRRLRGQGRQLVSRAAVPAVPPLLRGPGRLGQRHLPAADGHRLARPRAHRFAQGSRAGSGGGGHPLAALRPLGRGGGRPGGPAQAPPRHPDALLPLGRAVVGAGRSGRGQRHGSGGHRRGRGCRPDRRLAGPPGPRQPPGAARRPGQRGQPQRGGGQQRPGGRPGPGRCADRDGGHHGVLRAERVVLPGRDRRPARHPAPPGGRTRPARTPRRQRRACATRPVASSSGSLFS